MLGLMWLEEPAAYYTLNLGELVPLHTFPLTWSCQWLRRLRLGPPLATFTVDGATLCCARHCGGVATCTRHMLVSAPPC